MIAVKQAACSKAAVQWHQTTCRPDEFWTTVWRTWWRQTSGDGDWPQALTCTRLRDTTVCSRVVTCSVLASLPVSPHEMLCCFSERRREVSAVCWSNETHHSVSAASASVVQRQCRISFLYSLRPVYSDTTQLDVEWSWVASAKRL